MSADWAQEAPRLAKLARLELGPEEVLALAAACDAITRDFGALAAFAEELPFPGERALCVARSDEVVAATTDEVDGILGAAPKLDASRRFVVPRGLP